jgi:hypothetical protein
VTISLSDSQLKTVRDAAALLPPAQRANFLRSIAAVLDARDPPIDRDVEKALTFVLSARGVAIGHASGRLRIWGR